MSGGYDVGMRDTNEPNDVDETIEHADADREHGQDPAEGPEPDAERDDVPRVHPEEPTEG